MLFRSSDVDTATKMITDTAAEDVEFIFGTAFKEDLNDEMTITVIAAGYGDDVATASEDEEVIPIDNPLIDNPGDKKDTTEDDLDEILRMLEK